MTEASTGTIRRRRPDRAQTSRITARASSIELKTLNVCRPTSSATSRAKLCAKNLTGVARNETPSNNPIQSKAKTVNPVVAIRQWSLGRSEGLPILSNDRTPTKFFCEQRIWSACICCRGSEDLSLHAEPCRLGVKRQLPTLLLRTCQAHHGKRFGDQAHRRQPRSMLTG